jgi:hypothetical protein
MILADSHQDKGGHTYPSVNTIAVDAIMDERTCRRILASLEKKRLIVRERGEDQGRGKLTFYRFPELDDEPHAPKKGPQPERNLEPEGGHSVRLFFAQRGTEGGPKGDKTCTSTTKGRTGTETLNLIPPTPLARKGETVRPDDLAIECAVDHVMNECEWTKHRLRPKVRAVILMQLAKGAPADDTAARIVNVWTCQIKNSHLLKFKFGAANFLETGICLDANKLAWDHDRMDRDRGARVGSM